MIPKILIKINHSYYYQIINIVCILLFKYNIYLEKKTYTNIITLNKIASILYWGSNNLNSMIIIY